MVVDSQVLFFCPQTYGSCHLLWHMKHKGQPSGQLGQIWSPALDLIWLSRWPQATNLCSRFFHSSKRYNMASDSDKADTSTELHCIAFRSISPSTNSLAIIVWLALRVEAKGKTTSGSDRKFSTLVRPNEKYDAIYLMLSGRVKPMTTNIA